MARFVWRGRTVWWFFLHCHFLYIYSDIHLQNSEQHEHIKYLHDENVFLFFSWLNDRIFFFLIKLTIYFFWISNIFFSEVTCPIPRIKYGRVLSSSMLQFQEILTVTCVLGYMVNGSTTITCGRDRNFDAVPNCIGELLLITYLNPPPLELFRLIICLTQNFKHIIWVKFLLKFIK